MRSCTRDGKIVSHLVMARRVIAFVMGNRVGEVGRYVRQVRFWFSLLYYIT